MKGLLLKDWYMMQSYCRSYIILGALFIVLSLTGKGTENLFFVFYPCLLFGLLPVGLLGYDERSHWIQYSCTMPYTKAQLVSSKYLIGLLSQLAMLTATAITQGIKQTLSGTFVLFDFIEMILLILAAGLLTSSISLPFIFKYGVVKGRLAYYVVLGLACSTSVLASSILTNKPQISSDVIPSAVITVMTLAAIGLYAFSWYLSIVFYKKREIQ